MFEIIPRKTNKKAQSLIILFFIAAVALFAISVILNGMPYLWIVQLSAIIMLTAAVFVFTRYMAKIYIYRLEETEGGMDLTVTECSPNRKRQITVCRIGLDSIQSTAVLGFSQIKSKRKAKLPFFDYRPDINPEKSILIRSNEGGKEIFICLAYDEGLLGYLPNRKEENKDED